MIEEYYVSFELAKMLKEKGFDEYCSHFYRVDGEHEYCYKAKLPRLTNNDIRNHDDWVNRVFVCTCPTLQMAMKWLREVHNIFISPRIQNDGTYICYLYDTNGNAMQGYDKTLVQATYEKACEAAIKYCLENLI